MCERQDVTILSDMAAAPGLSFDALSIASPELALVDAALADELRQTLRSPTELFAVATPLTDRGIADPEPNSTVELVVTSDDPIVEQVDPTPPPTPSPTRERSMADDLIVFPEGESPLPALPQSEVGVEVDAPVDQVATTDDLNAASSFPVLPALDAGTTEETDEALRRIREHISAVDAASRPRRVRRGFVVASGLLTVCSVAVLTLGVELGVIQSPALPL